MAALARFEFVRAAWANPPAIKDSHRWSVKELRSHGVNDVSGRSPGPYGLPRSVCGGGINLLVLRAR